MGNASSSELVSPSQAEAVRNGVNSVHQGARGLIAMAQRGNSRFSAAGAAATGGAEGRGYFGGADPDGEDADPAQGLREYEASLSAQAKEDLIRRLARGLAAIGISVDPEAADLKSVTDALVQQIPNPAVNNKKFVDDAGKQATLCTAIAKVLNDVFTPGAVRPSDKFIDTTLSAPEICRQLGEWTHTFAAGVNTEFLAVVASVKNEIRSLEVLEQVLDSAHDKILARVNKVDDDKLRREISPLEELFARARAERTRQLELLKNLLHVQLAPAAKALEIAMREHSRDHALVKRLGLVPGTSDFSDTLAAAISGLGTAGSLAQGAHAALKKVGMSVDDYLSQPDLAQLVAALDRLSNSGFESKKLNAKTLAPFIAAVDELKQTFVRHDEPKFREALRAEAARLGGARRGGADSDDEYDALHGNGIQQRIEQSKSEKQIILHDFVRKVARHYEELLAAVKAMAPRLGREIPLSDQTAALRDALKRMGDMRSTSARIELALVGMYMDAEARAKKDQFVGALRVVSAACATLLGLDTYRSSAEHFTRLKVAIDNIEKSIDVYSDIISKKFGGASAAAEVVGGADDDLLPEIARSGLSFAEAIGSFAYAYYVAGVRANLDRSVKELDSYGEKYADLLGDAVAARLYSIESDRKMIMTKLEGWKPGPASAEPFIAVDPNASARFEATKTWVEQAFQVKAKFYRAVQAMDLYMKAFTAGIARDPDAIRDIKKMLDGTQVISRWFSETTGDELCNAFEQMQPCDANGALLNRPRIADVSGPHYYANVAALLPAEVGNRGVPQFGVTLGVARIGGANRATTAGGVDKSAENSRKHVDAVYDSFQALKNLVNAFARIGDKFGGREVRTQVFMSPAQIYKAIMDYLKQSALSLNHGVREVVVAALAAVNPVDATAAVPDAVPEWAIFFSSCAPHDALLGNFVQEDQYFVLIVKSMAAKVLTTLGVYDMFERSAPLFTLTPTRMIVGGGPDSEPEILEGAAELYFRLPRLAEFYRRVLRWEAQGVAADQLKIALLPELEGIFSGLVRLIFEKSLSGADTGDYTDTDINLMVYEINQIYSHFKAKYPDNVTRESLAAFVTEINRRYGVVKAKDMQDYLKMIRMTRRGEYEDKNETNYSILPGENDDTQQTLRAPSDRFTVPGVPGVPDRDPFANHVTLDASFDAGRWSLLNQFRADIDAQLAKVPKAEFGKTQYALLIKQAESEILRAQSRSAKFAVVVKLVQGSSITGLDSSKGLMFHETVVTGLNTLCAVQSILEKFYSQIIAMDPLAIENAILDAFHAIGAGAVGANTKAALQVLMNAATADIAVAAVTIYDRYIIPEVDGGSRSPRSGAADCPTRSHIYAALDGIAQTNNVMGGNVPLPANSKLSTFAGKPITAVAPLNSEEQVPVARALRIIARQLVDYSLIMTDLVDNVFSLVNQGMVEVRLSQNGMQLGFSKLRSACELILADVKQNFDNFRPYLPQAVLERYQDLTKPGSIAWIEKNLVDTFFLGTYETDKLERKKTLDGIAHKVTTVFANLVRDTYAPFNNVTDARMHNMRQVGGAAGILAECQLLDPNNNVGPIVISSRFEHFGQCFSQLVFYTEGASGLVSAADLTNTLQNALMKTARAAAGGAAPVPQTAAGAPAVRVTTLYSPTGTTTEHRSLLFAFNQLVARYLTSLVDTAGGERIYLNLINSFANGVASRSVAQPNGSAHPDLSVAGEQFGFRGDPKPEAVLFQSIAWMLQRIIKNVNPTNQIPDYLVSTLTDVPMYMKESMRANLPGFIKLFDLLTHKGDFFKQIFQKTSIRLDRPSQLITYSANVGDVILAGGNHRTMATANIYTLGALAALEVFDNTPRDSQNMKLRLAGVIDSITSGAFTLSNAASEVLKELGDSPVYFQTFEGSIEQYRMRYGRLPLMPLSLSLFSLFDVAGLAVDDPKRSLLFPNQVLGTPEFKFTYGTRQLLSRDTPVGFDQVPGVRALLEAHNGTCAAPERIDEARYLRFVQSVSGVLRFIADARLFKRHLISGVDADMWARTPLTAAAAAAGGPGIVTAGADVTAAFALTHTLQEVVAVPESSTPDEEVERIVRDFGGAGSASAGTSEARAIECVNNIIDMNIIPINVHALMRDVPLANLYNYAATFDQMVSVMYGIPYSHQPPAFEIAKSTRHSFVRLLRDPYARVEADEYGSEVLDLGSAGAVARIFRGDNDLGLGRPKFLSDQLFNKALFGSVYQSRADYDEAGPSVGIGYARGIGAAIGPMAEISRILGAILEVKLNFANAFDPLAGGNNLQHTDAVNVNARELTIRGLVQQFRRLHTELRSIEPMIPAALQALIHAVIGELDRIETELAAIETGGHNWHDITAPAITARRLQHGNYDTIYASVHVNGTALPGTVDEYNHGSLGVTLGALLTDDLNYVTPLRNEIQAGPLQPRNNAQARNQTGPRASRLTYLSKEGDMPQDSIVPVKLTVANKQQLVSIGKARFDTRIVRNLFFMSNVQRLVRQSLSRELTQSRSVLVSSHAVVASGVTEYGSDPFSANDVLASNTVDGRARFSDHEPLPR